jgi:hypothetical protein
MMRMMVQTMALVNLLQNLINIDCILHYLSI